MMENEKFCEGRCPHCDSYNIKSLEEYHDDEYLVCRLECMDCGGLSQEVYKTELSDLVTEYDAVVKKKIKTIVLQG